MEQLSQEDNQYQLKQSCQVLSHNYYDITPNLIIYDIYRSNNQYIRQPLCSVLNRDIIAQLDNPTHIHPTILSSTQTNQSEQDDTLAQLIPTGASSNEQKTASILTDRKHSLTR